ncbi:hypothetical protein D0860_03004 [Hortaea werneckii]|uniref:C2H2-type domain-containing protein n=1 Tax=Hortaea werneckii TaxID=91943 RepID=A0A3M7HGT9_HORWE|nr:hypothetical protein D0860_03004 [Hortaea werneckii]RMZ24619.1 hypothetical protein D0859_11329 [Hortaea werneckii]
MTAEFDQMLGSFSANRPQHPQMDNDALVGLDKQLIASGWTPVPSATNPLPSPVTPTSRLAGEPAFCAGRHCCQWSDGSYVCNNHYPSAEDLDRHVAQDHAGKLPSGQPSGEYHCHWAGCSKTESFGNKPKLTRHIHSHTGHKPHQCKHPGCGKGFVTKEQLKNHETTHTKTKQHVCPECGKGFAVKTALTSHMNVHRGTKPYICDECGKGFADSSNLSKHKAIHKRAALKKSHSRRQSACTSCHDSALASPSLMGPPPGMVTTFGSPYLPDFPAPSIEAATADMLPPEYCGLPCFDTHCDGTEKLLCRSASPCKSAPCSDRACSADPCNVPDCHPQDFCEFDHCFDGNGGQACDFPQCSEDHQLQHYCPAAEDQPCSFEPCDLGDGCTQQDCHPQFCGGGEHDAHHFDCFGLSDDTTTTTTLSTPSTRPSISHHTNPSIPPLSSGMSSWHGAARRPHDAHFPQHTQLDGSTAAVTEPFSLDHDDGLSEGFKQLNDFIHDCGDFCGCTAAADPLARR